MAETESGLSLLERFRDGDRDAFSRLYELHHRAIFRFAMNMSFDASVADEITQDVFVWLVRNSDRFDPQRGELGAFLLGVARKLLRSRRRLALRWLPLQAAVTAGIAAAAEGERQAEMASLRYAIARLPARYREALALCDLEGRSYEEAAAVAGCAVGTIRSRLHRARALLARRFQPQKGDGRWL